MWTKYSKDLARNVKYIEYIQSIPILDILLTPSYKDDLIAYVNVMNTTAITTVKPVCTVYLDLRHLGLPLSRSVRALGMLEKCMRWYNDDLDIPNKLEYFYVLECSVESWVDTKHTGVIVHSKLLGERFMMTSASVTFFCYPAPLKSAMKLVDAAFIEQYPCVLSRLDERGDNKGHNYDRNFSSSSSSMHI